MATTKVGNAQHTMMSASNQVTLQIDGRDISSSIKFLGRIIASTDAEQAVSGMGAFDKTLGTLYYNGNKSDDICVLFEEIVSVSNTTKGNGELLTIHDIFKRFRALQSLSNQPVEISCDATTHGVDVNKLTFKINGTSTLLVRERPSMFLSNQYVMYLPYSFVMDKELGILQGTELNFTTCHQLDFVTLLAI